MVLGADSYLTSLLPQKATLIKKGTFPNMGAGGLQWQMPVATPFHLWTRIHCGIIQKACGS